MWSHVGTRRRSCCPAGVVALLALCTPGCPVDVAVVGDDPRVQLLGAAELDDVSGARLRFSSAGFRVRFEGRLRVIVDGVGGDVNDLADEEGGNRWSLVVQADEGGALPLTAPTIPTTTGALPASFLIESGGPATLTLVKKTEALFGAARALAVVVEAGRLLPPPATEPGLLVVGDSFVSGFGVLGDVAEHGVAPGPRCAATADNTDVTRAWPFVVGAALDRDVAVVAWSGRGVLRDWQGSTRPLTVPEIWGTATLARDFDDVVIALGGNDFAEGAPDVAAFNAAWQNFLLALPGPPRVVALLPNLGPPPQIEIDDAFVRPPPGVVVDIGAAIPTLRSGEGCLWHPGTRAHAEYGAALVPVLQQWLRRPR